MRKKITLICILFCFPCLLSCEKYLDRQPLDTPTTGSFLNNQQEMNAALTAVYRSINWDRGLTPFQQFFDLWSDIGQFRDPGIATGVFDTYNTDLENLWKAIYITIQRSNTLITGMEKGKANVNETIYNRIQGEARLIRAWAYYHLTFMYGDVPLITRSLNPDEYNAERTNQKEIIAYLLKELDEVAPALDWRPTERGRIGRGVALGLKARIALNNGQFDIAAEAAKAVINSNSFGLNPKFQDLFTRSGQLINAGNEIMYEFFRSDNSPLDNRNYVPLGQASRNLGGQSGKFPTQRLVDMFECSDGKRIDESAVYDPANPSKNRDQRLKWTVVMHGDTITHYGAAKVPKRCIFNIYDNTTPFFNFNTGLWANATNNDKSNAFGPVSSGVGYLWSKYTLTDENLTDARVSWIYMRYAEILLTYAEAKIELNQIDQSVIIAINALRSRGKLPEVDLAIQSDQQKMKQLIRRERSVELALEGFRWYDIRRWKIAELVMPGKIIGASKDRNVVASTPNFKSSAITDLNNIPDYSSSEAQRITRDTRYFSPNQYLMPIPQRERDINKKLSQNDGWN